ncbi:MAG: murein biosynthesis integral membrane protein MurJ [Clostridia bacterium]|nr:murein biosynthesis integral membrane protein MurJ [Clostridia bacterium]
MNKVFKTISGMFIIMLLAKVLGQAREVLLAWFYGTGTQASAFLTASQIPLNFFDMILGLAIVSAFVPVFNEYYQKEGETEANRFANNFIGVVLIISAALAAIGIIFSDFVIKVIASGFDTQTARLASNLLKIMFPSLIFTAVAYSYAGIVQSYGEFKLPAAMSIASNLVAILYFLVFNDIGGIFGLSVAMLIGWGLQLIILIPALIRFKYRFGLSFDFLHPGMKKVYKLALPILLSSWVQPLNVMINLYLASFIDGGNAVSYINYANKLYIIIVGVFAMSVTNLILPRLSRLFADNQTKESADVITSSLRAGILFIVPVMFLFLIFSYQIVEIVYMRGAFDSKSVYMTSTALFFYSFGMLGYGLQEILNKSFYSMQNSVVPMKNAFFTIVINIALSFLLYRQMGVGGLALSSAIASVFSAVNLTIQIKRKVKQIKLRDIISLLIKATVCAGVSCLISRVLYTFLISLYTPGFFVKFTVLALSVLFTFVIYIAGLLILRVKDFKNILKRGVDSD